MSRDIRRYAEVPRGVLLAAVLALSLQIGLGWQNLHPDKKAEALPPVLPDMVALTASLGEPRWFSRLLSVWLQTFDYQSGISISWQDLDYDKLTGWLQLQLLLDANNPFPLLAATHLYGAVAERAKARKMINYIALAFRESPATRWRWMSEAVIMAKHRLGDLALAERLASQLAEQVRGLEGIPAWTRQMHIFLKAEVGQQEAAIALLGALLESGEIDDPGELRFLHERMKTMINAREAGSPAQSGTSQGSP